MSRFFTVVYGVFCYLVFLVVMVDASGFLTNEFRFQPGDGSQALPWYEALGIDVLLLALFGLQHSGMARQSFKDWWTRWVPRHLERSTYVLASSLAFAFLLWQWRPFSLVAENVAPPNSQFIGALALFGAVLLVVAVLQMEPLDLLGLRQIYAYARGQEYPDAPFRTPGLYRWVRHPMMLGLLIVLWTTCWVSLDHVLFAAGMTVYVLIGVRLEERDLLNRFGPLYAEYQKRVPQLIPALGPWPEMPEMPED
jgi:protein-S-isoprenylcysteine O-methyltransferase Ste14